MSCENKQINHVLQLECFGHHEMNLISLSDGIPGALLVTDTLMESEYI